MSDQMREFKPTPTEISSGVFDAAAIKAVSGRFQGLKELGEKASQVARLVRDNINQGLLTAAGIGMIISSGCGNTEKQNPQSTKEPTPISTPFIPEATKIPEPTITPTETPTQPDYEYIDASGLKIAIDKDGLPVSYLSSDGKDIKFDKEEMQKLREKAIANEEPEIIIILTPPASKTVDPNYLSSYTAEHPRVSELPKDVLSDEDLQKRGVTIVQTEKTNLHIRKSAFEKDGPLADFNDAAHKKLNIVLVDGPYVSAYFINDDNKSFLGMLHSPDPDVIKRYRSKKIALAEEQLKMYSTSTSHLRVDELLWLKAELYKYQNTLTYKEIATELFSAGIRRVPGQYFEEERLYKQSPSYGQTTIVLAVGETISSNKREVLAFDANGNFINRNFFMNQKPYDESPQPETTHPNPSDIKLIKANDKGYLYESSGVGFTLEHEVGHHGANLKGEQSEKNADIYAMNTIKKAWEVWEKSGFTDNSGYPFVFSLSKERGGGYILTGKANTDSLPSNNM